MTSVWRHLPYFHLFLSFPGFCYGTALCSYASTLEFLYCLQVYISLTHRCVSEQHVVRFESGLTHSPSDSALVLQLALRNTLPLIPGVEAEHWTPPPPGLVYLWSHNALGNRRREERVGLFRRTTAGILQSNGHVFTLRCFLISQCNESNIKKIDSFSSRTSVEQTIQLWHCNCNLADCSNILSLGMGIERCSVCWLTTYYSLLNYEILNTGLIRHGKVVLDTHLIWFLQEPCLLWLKLQDSI